MIDISLYCKQENKIAQTYVIYNESYSDSSEMRLFAFVGGNIGSGNFDTEWCLINFDEDGNPVSAVVAEDCDGSALVEIKRSYVFDQDAWGFIPGEISAEPVVDPEVVNRIQSVNKRWIEFDEGDRLVVSDLMSYQFESSDEATVGDVDEDQLEWLAKIWSLRA